eukprot:1373917-Pleurochrysis_carterae.AAC.1
MRKRGHTRSRACVRASTIVVPWASIDFGELAAEVAAAADSMSRMSGKRDYCHHLVQVKNRNIRRSREIAIPYIERPKLA